MSDNELIVSSNSKMPIYSDKLTDEQKVAIKNAKIPEQLLMKHIGGPWTQFWDMHSGGGTKESPFAEIYIQAPEAEATIIFYNIFGHNPERVTCTCCGPDYSTSESQDLAKSSGHHRNCRFDRELGEYVDEAEPGRATFIPLAEYIRRPDVLAIFSKDINADWRTGTAPTQGYVWQE
jgi:hypothetical protein